MILLSVHDDGSLTMVTYSYFIYFFKFQIFFLLFLFLVDNYFLQLYINKFKPCYRFRIISILFNNAIEYNIYNDEIIKMINKV